MIAIHLSNQQELDADPKTSFTSNLDRAGHLIMFLLLKKQKKS